MAFVQRFFSLLFQSFKPCENRLSLAFGGAVARSNLKMVSFHLLGFWRVLARRVCVGHCVLGKG